MGNLRQLHSISREQHLLQSSVSAVPIALAFAQHLHSDCFDRGHGWASANARQNRKAPSSFIEDIVSRLPESRQSLLDLHPDEPLLDLHLSRRTIEGVENARGKLRKELKALEERWTVDFDEEEQGKESRKRKRKGGKEDKEYWSSNADARQALVITLKMRLAESQAYLRNGHIFAFILAVLSSQLRQCEPDADKAQTRAQTELCTALVETLERLAKSTATRSQAIAEDMEHFDISKQSKVESASEGKNVGKIITQLSRVSAALSSIAFTSKTLHGVRHEKGQNP